MCRDIDCHFTSTLYIPTTIVTDSRPQRMWCWWSFKMSPDRLQPYNWFSWDLEPRKVYWSYTHDYSALLVPCSILSGHRRFGEIVEVLMDEDYFTSRRVPRQFEVELWSRAFKLISWANFLFTTEISLLEMLFILSRSRSQITALGSDSPKSTTWWLNRPFLLAIKKSNRAFFREG